MNQINIIALVRLSSTDGYIFVACYWKMGGWTKTLEHHASYSFKALRVVLQSEFQSALTSCSSRFLLLIVLS